MVSVNRLGDIASLTIGKKTINSPGTEEIKKRLLSREMARTGKVLKNTCKNIKKFDLNDSFKRTSIQESLGKFLDSLSKGEPSSLSRLVEVANPNAFDTDAKVTKQWINKYYGSLEKFISSLAK